jgi:hypothetical protein
MRGLFPSNAQSLNRYRIFDLRAFFLSPLASGKAVLPKASSHAAENTVAFVASVFALAGLPSESSFHGVKWESSMTF